LSLLKETIDRVERVNPKLNAVVTETFDRARETIASSSLPEDAPFAGVPFLLKDLLASQEGVRFTFGSRMMEDHVADHDSYLVQRYREAGLIFAGKTNAPEFGLQPTTEPELFGPCRNPWNPARTPGGSSGGSAAAVASGIVPMAHGNDGGGSLRIPASCCGLFGLRPTRARTTLGPDYGDLMSGFVIEHAITRTVRDSAALLDATRGPSPGDPYRAPEPEGSYLEASQQDPEPLSVGMITEPPTGSDLHPDSRRATEDAAELCEELGHSVDECSLDLDNDLLREAFMTVWAAGAAATVEGATLVSGREPGPENLEPLTLALYEMGQEFSASDYLASTTLLQKISRDYQQEYFGEYDVLLTPTLAEPPLKLGELDADPDNPLSAFERASEFAAFTPLSNVTGQPAMSVPLYWNDDELPIGTQFVGPFGREDLLFRLAGQLERARPWKNRLPPINVTEDRP
jgi:amidase